ncbi:MAG: Rid family detoxifying hydrolase [Planctomycetota bacterium]|nr:Rid family detoxifying hydrolase [Planctomycetota bacterium]
MSGIEYISTGKAPAAIGPYSQAVRAGDLLFCSGQIPKDPATGTVETTDIRRATDLALGNLKAVLEAAGAGPDRVVKTTVYLADLRDFEAMNERYAAFFGSHRPARATVQAVRLPAGSPIEIEAVAYLGS